MRSLSGIEVGSMSVGVLKILVVFRSIRDELFVARDIFSCGSHDHLMPGKSANVRRGWFNGDQNDSAATFLYRLSGAYGGNGRGAQKRRPQTPIARPVVSGRDHDFGTLSRWHH